MDAARKGGPPQTPVLERPGAPEETVSYIRIDFHRCVVRRGTKAKPPQDEPRTAPR